MLDSGYIVLRALGAIIALFGMTRLLGKKQISQLTFFEYITGITIGDLAGFISTDVEANYLHGMIAIMVWFLIPFFVEWISLKSTKLRYIFEGKGTIVIQHGVILEKNLGKERFTADELLEQLRVKNVFNAADVEFAMLETTGEISVLLKPEKQPLTPQHLNMVLPVEHEPVLLIADGSIRNEGLNDSGRSKAWLYAELEKLGLSVNEIFLAQVDSMGKLYVDVYDDPNHVTNKGKNNSDRKQFLIDLKQCQFDLMKMLKSTDDQNKKSIYLAQIHQLHEMRDKFKQA
ncbi:DUF421 domain-containing protein [Paenibacillus sp. KN14-4R]|uniref:DUF421 domain-containing protein n=1 Tax=Paenibacillus sp. KN14-4R TaxID=3445773 RepID=UPI003FA10C3F